MVSLLSGENDMAQPLVFLRTGREQRRGTPSAYPSRYGHITAPHLIWFRYGELSLKMIRDSNVLMTATLIPVSRLLATDQPQLFHESASKPAPHLVTSLGCHCGDASCSGRAVADAMQFKYLTA
jgi:hypothetical protein